MKKVLFLTVILSLFLFTGCHKNKKSFILIEAASAIKKDGADTVSLERAGRDIKIIPLETGGDFLIGRINDIVVLPESLYIVEEKKCAEFNREGRFIRMLGSRGRGPGEYLHIDAFFVEPEKECIGDLTAKKILYYDRTGAFLREKEIPSQIKDLTSIYPGSSGEYIAFTPDMGKVGKSRMLTFFSPEGAITDSIPYPYLIEKVKGTVSFGFKEGQFISSGDEIKFKYMFNDTVYKISGKEIIPEYVFGLDDLKANRDARVELSKDFMAMPMSKMARMELLGESSRYLFFSVNDEPVYFYDKKEKKVRKWRLVLPEKLKKGMVAPEDPHAKEPVFTPLRIDKTGKLIGIARPAKEDQNPVVIIADLN